MDDENALSPSQSELISSLVSSILNSGKVFKYAVVHWFNYRKDLHAGFLKGFYDLELAKNYAYRRAYEDMLEHNNDKVITEDEITDINGPGKYGSPYKSLIGYGGICSDGYMTMFYCVVEWFEGVTNDWDGFETYEEEEGKWYPRYECTSKRSRKLS